MAGAEGGETRVLAPVAFSWGHSGRIACRLGIGSVEKTAFGAGQGRKLFPQ